MRVRELLALILSLMMVQMAGAQDPVQVASAGGMNLEDLRVTVSKSLVIDYPADISRISTSNPEIVDAVPATSREFLLHGKGHGSATVVVWAKNGMRTMYKRHGRAQSRSHQAPLERDLPRRKHRRDGRP